MGKQQSFRHSKGDVPEMQIHPVETGAVGKVHIGSKCLSCLFVPGIKAEDSQTRCQFLGKRNIVPGAKAEWPVTLPKE